MLRLDDQLCFALYAATNAVTRAYRPLLRQIGLTYPQYLAMLVLWQDGACPVGHIAARLSLPQNALGPILDRLEENRLIERRRDPDDRRMVRVELARAGIDLEIAASVAQQAVACQTRLEPDALGALRDELKSLVFAMETGATPGSAPETRARWTRPARAANDNRATGRPERESPDGETGGGKGKRDD